MLMIGMMVVSACIVSVLQPMHAVAFLTLAGVLLQKNLRYLTAPNKPLRPIRDCARAEHKHGDRNRKRHDAVVVAPRLASSASTRKTDVAHLLAQRVDARDGYALLVDVRCISI